MIVIFCIRISDAIFVIPQGTCKFYPSCSNYAKEAMDTLPTNKAVFLILKRLLKCNPFNKNFGYDPVPKINERPSSCE